uniref:Transposable element Tcb2 transposase n=1 Tax=Bactrocera latifrons TaxID=174628 RepID=A0A0K8UIS9_BACLA
MNKFDYLNILKNNVAPSVEKLGLSENWIFQQDNDPKQKSKIVSEWLLYRTPKTLDHPPQSPDLNPIEHLWEHFDRKIRQRSISSKDDLKQALTEEWSKISPEVTKNLTESMPRRLTEVLKSKGKQTKY